MSSPQQPFFLLGYQELKQDLSWKGFSLERFYTLDKKICAKKIWVNKIVGSKKKDRKNSSPQELKINKHDTEQELWSLC